MMLPVNSVMLYLLPAPSRKRILMSPFRSSLTTTSILWFVLSRAYRPFISSCSMMPNCYALRERVRACARLRRKWRLTC